VLASAHARLCAPLHQLGQYSEALSHAERAMSLFAAIGNHNGHALAARYAARQHNALRQPALACKLGQQAVDLYARSGETGHLAIALDTLGVAHAQLGDYPAAIACFLRACGIFQRLGGHSRAHAGTLLRLGDSHQALGDIAAARDAWRRGLDVLGELDHQPALEYRAKLARLRGRSTRRSLRR
jgi:tetratricopeptide (TPR) repeat protein